MRSLFIFVLLLLSLSSFSEELYCRLDKNGFYSALALGDIEDSRIEDGLGYMKKMADRDLNTGAIAFGFYYIEENTLEAKYCKTLFNNHEKLKSVFERNIGVPAKNVTSGDLYILENKDIRPVSFFESSYSKNSTVLRVSANGMKPFEKSKRGNRDQLTDYVKRTYQNGLEGISQIDERFIEEGTDWESLLELNLRGKNLWQMVIEKSRAFNSNSPEEEARYNYFNRNKFVKDRNENKKIQNDIFEYKKAVFDFLDSTEMKVNYGLSKMSSFDPFFVQVVLEFFVSTNIYTLFDKRELIRHDYSSESLIIERSIYPDDYIVSGFHDENKIEEIQREVTYKSNLVPLLTMIFSNPGCEYLGLRPELTRTIIQGFDPDLFSIFLREQYRSLITNNEKYCGNVDYFRSKSAHSFIYSNSSKFLEDIVERFRDLSYIKGL